MGTQYTIGQLAAAADIPTSTLRYYERIGLLKPDDRSMGNYRLYSEETLERVRFIRAAQGTGFTLDDIASLLNLRVAAKAPCEDVQVVIERRLAEIKQRLADLRHVQTVLRSFLGKCSQSRRREHCAVIEELTAASASSTSRRQKAARGRRRKNS